MIDTIPGWAVELRGKKIDLDDAMEIFGDGYRLTIRPHQQEGETIELLRSRDWSALDSAREVMADAEQIVRELNGALLLTYGDSEPLGTGRVLRWDASGAKMPVVAVASGTITLGGFRVRGRLTTGGTNGPPPPPPARAWIDYANASDLMSELLVHIGRATDWFDLFKAIELTQKVFSEYQIRTAMGKSRWKLWLSARRCANFRRHSKAKQEPMLEPDLTFREAKRRVVKDIRFLFDSGTKQLVM